MPKAGVSGEEREKSKKPKEALPGNAVIAMEKRG